MKNFLAAAAAISVAVAPTAATAGTRAGDVVPATYSVDRASATAESASELGGAGLIIAIIAGVAVIVGVIAAASDDDDNLSDG
jgi:hypothetical protein